MSYVDNIMNSIVISYVSCMDIKTTILSLKHSSTDYNELPASIAKQCIDNYVVPLIYIVNMSLMEGVFPSYKVTNFRPISVLSFFSSKIFEKNCIIMLLILWLNMIQFINISLGLETTFHSTRYYNTC